MACKNCKCKQNHTKEITKDMTISEVLNSNPNLRTVFEGFGMHCIGCPMSQMETLEEASQAHEIDLDFMLEKLNQYKN